jgi:NET1-associated nuclear protein 1 (U3 small nucleolar RNA-associated protein 17)
MKTIRVGGPLLGGRCLLSKTVSKRGKPSTTKDDLKSWTTFEPIITPPISKRKEQFILLPTGSFITVLAYKTGRRVASLIPLMEDEKMMEKSIIESACLATFPSSPPDANDVADALRKLKDDNDDTSDDEPDNQEDGDCHVLFVGCRDGTVREFDLSVLAHQLRGASSSSCGLYDIPGPCHRPRRVFSLSDKSRPVKHLTSLSNISVDNGVLLYALCETKSSAADGSSKPSKVNSYLHRIVLAPYDRKSHGDCKTIPLTNKGDPPYENTLERLKCLVGYDKEGVYHNNTPFRLLSVSRKASKTFSELAGGVDDRDVFVIVARSTTLHVYYEKIKSSKIKGEMQSIIFNISPKNPLSAVSVAPNGTDIACGYMEGEMRVMSDALPQIVAYFQEMLKYKNKQGPKPDDPAKTVLTRRVHWHAHPVTSLAYHGVSDAVDPMLYSGGNESVLVTWQLSKGTYRPADVLPRLAKGGIVHICCAGDVSEESASGILVYCEDNSLQLFESHNKSLLWKVQGLASFTGDSLGDGNARVQSMIRADSLSGENTLMLSGLPGAPGCLHWYDTREQRVSSQLEVGPFNRISRTEYDDSPMPVPSVTNCTFSESGHELVTLDTTPTENSYIGAPYMLRDGSAVGVVSTLRFWSWTPPDQKVRTTASPYSLTASMTSPHGEENRVTALAISKDGQFACTVSNDENAFRLWHRVPSDTDDEENEDVDKKSRRAPAWMCRYKVTTPSGYSNFGTSSDALDFSSDGSILAICYGNMITLWDHKEATLLTALQHLEDDRTPIDSLSFVKTSFLHDLILTKSRTGVTLQSPFGSGHDSWSCVLPTNCKDAFVAQTELIPSHDLVVVCMVFPNKAKSRILVLDALSGTPRMESQDGKSKPMTWEISGVIRFMGVQGKPTKFSNWVDVNSFREEKSEKQASPIRLYVTMDNGDMLLLQSAGAAQSLDISDSLSANVHRSGVAATDAPRLNMLKWGEGRKRRRNEVFFEKEAPPTKRSAESSFGTSLGDDGGESAPLASSDLPALGGAFTRAFISRAIAKNTHSVFGEDS